MGAYVSKDRHWRVQAIRTGGRELLRVEHDMFWMPGHVAVPLHTVHPDGRTGLVRTAHGFLVAEVTSVAAVERYVDLKDLREVK